MLTMRAALDAAPPQAETAEQATLRVERDAALRRTLEEVFTSQRSQTEAMRQQVQEQSEYQAKLAAEHTAILEGRVNRLVTQQEAHTASWSKEIDQRTRTTQSGLDVLG